MKSDHLSEMEMQLYALNKPGCEPRVNEHLEECGYCKCKAAAYRALFSEIKQQPKPVFDFDLPGLVLTQLPKSNRRLLLNDFFILLLVFVALSIIGITVYMFRKFLSNVFSSISTFFIYTIIITATTVIILKCTDMYRSYKMKMNVLNFG